MIFRKKYILLNGLILLLTGGFYGLNIYGSSGNIDFPEVISISEAPQNVVATDTTAPRFR